MEENKTKLTKRQKLAKYGKLTLQFLAELIATIFSGIVVVFLYILYIPFAVGRALFNAKAVRGFYSDVFFAIDGINERIRKRENGEVV